MLREQHQTPGRIIIQSRLKAVDPDLYESPYVRKHYPVRSFHDPKPLPEKAKQGVCPKCDYRLWDEGDRVRCICGFSAAIPIPTVPFDWKHASAIDRYNGNKVGRVRR